MFTWVYNDTITEVNKVHPHHSLVMKRNSLTFTSRIPGVINIPYTAGMAAYAGHKEPSIWYIFCTVRGGISVFFLSKQKSSPKVLKKIAWCFLKKTYSGSWFQLKKIQLCWAPRQTTLKQTKQPLFHCDSWTHAYDIVGFVPCALLSVEISYDNEKGFVAFI